MDIRNYFTSLTPRSTTASGESKSNSEMNNGLKNKKRKQEDFIATDSEEPIPKRRGRKKKVTSDEEEPIPKTVINSPKKKNQVSTKDRDAKSAVSSKRKLAQVSEPVEIDLDVPKSPARKKEAVRTPTKVKASEQPVIDIVRSPVTRSRAAASPSPIKIINKDAKNKTPSPKLCKVPEIKKGGTESPLGISEQRKSPRKIPMKFDEKPKNNLTSLKPATNHEKIVSKSEEQLTVAQMFVDKYKPTNSKQLIGQQGDRSNAKKLARWLLNWHSNVGKKPAYNRGGMSDDSDGFRAALLSGPPGVGKTTTANVICRELGFDVTELNASDARNKKSLEEHVSTLLHNKVLSFNLMQNGNKQDGTKHVLIMDEVDGMAGNEDRGGVQELIQLIKKTQVPVICICNDRSHPKIRSLVNYCYDLRFYKPTIEQIKAAMMSLCFKEKITVSNDVLQELIVSTNRDIRQVMHSLSLLSAKDSKDINKMMSNCSLKDIKLGPFDAIKKVFTAGPEYNEMSFKDKSDLFFMDYSLMSLFCFENYIKVHPVSAKKNEAERLKLAAKSIDAIAFGDLIEKEIRTTNNWSLLPVQAVFSTVMPSVYMNGSMPHMSTFPSLLGKISATNRKDRLLQELSTHMSLTISGDKSSLNLDYLEPLKQAITEPLITKGNDGVKDVLEVLHAYNLLKEDIETIMELSCWNDEKNPMTKVDSKTKAALTRAYNKDGELLPYDSQDIKKGKKVTAAVTDEMGLNGAEDEAEEVEEEEDNDFAVRAKKKTTKKTSKEKESNESKVQKPKATASKRGRKKQ